MCCRCFRDMWSFLSCVLWMPFPCTTGLGLHLLLVKWEMLLSLADCHTATARKKPAWPCQLEVDSGDLLGD
ncbi:hypothetical protein AAG906_013986 [Vitis piasezkii]